MYSFKELKEMMKNEETISYKGTEYRKITAITFRPFGDYLTPSVELLDPANNSVVVVDIKNIEGTGLANDCILNKSEVFESIANIEKHLEMMKVSLSHEDIEQSKQAYVNMMKSALVLDRGINDYSDKVNDLKIVRAVKGSEWGIDLGSDEGDSNSLSYEEIERERKLFNERLENFDEDDPETKKQLEEFVEECEKKE